MKRKSHDDIAVLVDAAKAVVSQEDLTDYAPPFTLKEVEAEKSSHANDKTALVLMLNHLLFLMARLSAAERPAPTCEWMEDGEHEVWATQCGDVQAFITDGPTENRYKFCPYCGKQIELPAPPGPVAQGEKE